MTLIQKIIGLLSISIVALSILSFKTKSIQSYESAPSLDIIDIDTQDVTLLNHLQGQWLGINSVAGMDFNWFSWDYRPIASSHIHGIYEGGSMGNLFTSFFVANFKGKKTIMARNGGVLNGIYRTSYFVLDQVKQQDDEQYYRLVDAVGGKNTMYMELRFKNDSLYWNAYTSQLGHQPLPTRHMTFKGKKYRNDLSTPLAQQFNFPSKDIAYEFPNGFDNSYLYMKSSASFLWQSDSNIGVAQMAKSALDPITIEDYPHLASLKINLEQKNNFKDKRIILYVSTTPLTTSDGELSKVLADYDSNILFSFLDQNETEFKYTYIHPGDYYVTAIVDMDNNYVISPGDFHGESIAISVLPNSKSELSIKDIKHESKSFIFQNLGNDFYKEEHAETTTTEVPVIDWTVSFNKDIKPIINNNCITCHSGPSPSAHLDLTSRRDIKMAIKRKHLIQRMNDAADPMPPKKLLPLKERMLIFKWKKDGFLE